jgi:ABC-type transport system substrate-binding protein
MTYPVEPDLAESWTSQRHDLRLQAQKGVRWHNKPPVNGRELTADDVKYTYERFLTITGNPTSRCSSTSTRSRRSTSHTVKFTLKEPNAWFLDLLASTSTWIVAKECVEKFGDLKKVEVGGRHRPLDARAVGAQRQAQLRPEPQLLFPGPPLRRRGRAAHRQGPGLASGHVARLARRTSAR